MVHTERRCTTSLSLRNFSRIVALPSVYRYSLSLFLSTRRIVRRSLGIGSGASRLSLSRSRHSTLRHDFYREPGLAFHGNRPHVSLSLLLLLLAVLSLSLSPLPPSAHGSNSAIEPSRPRAVNIPPFPRPRLSPRRSMKTNTIVRRTFRAPDVGPIRGNKPRMNAT